MPQSNINKLSKAPPITAKEKSLCSIRIDTAKLPDLEDVIITNVKNISGEFHFYIELPKKSIVVPLVALSQTVYTTIGRRVSQIQKILQEIPISADEAH